MLTPSPEIIQLLATFASAFTQPTFQKAQVLIYGSVLAPGKRTVTAALRTLGVEDHNFGKYHRVLNQARFSPWLLSRLLLGLRVTHFVAPGGALVLVVDATLERRQGQQIVYKGCFRDAVRSTAHKLVTRLGLRWLCVCLRVSVPSCTQRHCLSNRVAGIGRKRPPSAMFWARFALICGARGIIRTRLLRANSA